MLTYVRSTDTLLKLRRGKALSCVFYGFDELTTSAFGVSIYMGSNGNIKKDKVVMSIGGSLIVPNGGINVDFLKKLNHFIRDQLAKNPTRQFFLVSGGGSISRHYRDAGRDVLGHE